MCLRGGYFSRALVVAILAGLASQVFAADPKVIGYLELLKLHPELKGGAKAASGEIEVLDKAEEIQKVEKDTKRPVGLILSDPYWILLNDAVRFPNGKTGVYGRLLWRASVGRDGPVGVAVLMITPDNKIVLNRNYRHATRSWEYEMPRGGINNGESLEDAAQREVKEETGFDIIALKSLGQMANDSGMTSGITALFLAKTAKKGKSSPEASEAIAEVEAFTLNEVNSGLMSGFISFRDKEKTVEIPIRDSFLMSAMYQAKIRSYL